jgi:uncharacterized protein YjiS (DUF1127 family)
MSFLAHRSRTALAVRRLVSAARRLRRQFDTYRLEQRERLRMAAELATSSDRELGELGYSRADLISIARGTYQR